MKRFLAVVLGLGLVLAPAYVFAGTIAITSADKGTFTSGDGGVRVIEFTFEYNELDGSVIDSPAYYNSNLSFGDSEQPYYLGGPYRVIGVDWQPDTNTAIASGVGLGCSEVPDDNGDIEIRSIITGVDILNGAGDDLPATSSDGDEFFRVPADSKSSGYIITRLDEGIYIWVSNMNVINSNAKGKYYLYLQQL